MLHEDSDSDSSSSKLARQNIPEWNLLCFKFKAMATVYNSGLLLQMCIQDNIHLLVPNIFLRIIFQNAVLALGDVGRGVGVGVESDATRRAAAITTTAMTVQPYY